MAARPFARALRVAAVALAVAAVVVFARRWVHHAQLELEPVIVPPGADVQALVRPPAHALAGRMVLDVEELVHPPERPRLAVLTFDDGPYPVATPLLLAKLEALGVPADFFLIGRDSREQPAVAASLSAAGMELGNHSLTHPEMSALVLPAQLEEIGDGAKAIAAATGVRVRYFRPPHGNYNGMTLFAAHSLGETVAFWDVDPGDWRTRTPDEIAGNVIAHAKAPAVILLHDGKLATIQALEPIVAAYRRAGFRFVTLSGLQRAVPLDDINNPVKVKL